jgi:hypothetical protein
MTPQEWETKYGKPDANGVCDNVPTRHLAEDSLVIAIRTGDGIITGIKIRRKSGRVFAGDPARKLIAQFRSPGGDLVRLGDALSEDSKTITLLSPKPEPSPYTMPGKGKATKKSALMGKTPRVWKEVFGEPDGDGYYESGIYCTPSIPLGPTRR